MQNGLGSRRNVSDADRDRVMMVALAVMGVGFALALILGAVAAGPDDMLAMVLHLMAAALSVAIAVWLFRNLRADNDTIDVRAAVRYVLGEFAGMALVIAGVVIAVAGQALGILALPAAVACAAGGVDLVFHVVTGPIR